MRYTITVVEIRKNYKQEKEVGNTTSNPGLNFPTIEAAEELCKQLGIENYQIIDATSDWSGYNVVKQSQTITDIETREKNNRDNKIKEKTARVVEINKLPIEFRFKSYKIDGKKINFYFARDEASFDHHRSWKIQCGLSFCMKVDGKEQRSLWLSDYSSQYGKRIMRKKFENEMLSRLFNWYKWHKEPKDEKQVQAVAPIVVDLEEMIKKERELRNKIS